MVGYYETWVRSAAKNEKVKFSVAKIRKKADPSGVAGGGGVLKQLSANRLRTGWPFF